MRLHLICVGRCKAGPERELAAHYVARAAAVGRSLGVATVEMREIDESRAKRPQERKKDEARAIRSVLAGLSGSFVACDETGETLTSAVFAQRLGRLREQSVGSLALIIGGPDGLEADLCAEAAFTIAFGAMTWPHQLARIMAAEQMYRALTLLAGHPYHRV